MKNDFIPSIFHRGPDSYDVVANDHKSSHLGRLKVLAIVLAGVLTFACAAWLILSTTSTKECGSFAIGKSAIGGCDHIG
jgi:hypothetical protein